MFQSSYDSNYTDFDEINLNDCLVWNGHTYTSLKLSLC